MNKEQKEIYEYEPIYSQAEIDEWMRVAEEYKEKIKELEAENAELKKQRKKMFQACYEEAGLTPDCNPYYCVKKLVAENAELKARLEKAVELPLKIGSSFWYFDSDGVLRHHIMQANVCGYSESEWQGSVNQGKDHRFIIFHNSYNQPFAVELKNCFASRAEAEARLKELEETKK